MLARPPTQRQLSVLSFIVDYQARHQRPPTRRDIALRFKIRVSAAHRHVVALERRGIVHRERGRHRAIAMR